MEIKKVREGFEITENGKRKLTAKEFFSAGGAKLPKTAEEFEKGLENGAIVFVKKGTEIESRISRYTAEAGNDECCYAVFARKGAYKRFGITEASNIPFEWQ